MAAPGWTTSAVFFDYDGDSRLDLFVGNYVRYGLDTPTSCSGDPHGKRYFCVPRIFDPVTSFLFHNEGNGRFTDVSAATGFARAPGKALGVVATDFNNDGLLDLFVTNDTSPNTLWMNRGGGRWEDVALAAGVAFSANGKPRSSMGVDSADFDADGWPDVAIGNIDHEIFALYRNRKDESFVDEAEPNGLAAATLVISCWGLKLFDYDNDGWPDLFLANGHPDDMLDGSAYGVRYRQPPMLFHNEGGRYRNVSAQAGPAFRKEFSARGLAVGDLDNDGRVDVLVANNGMAPLLLRNESGEGNHWLGVKLRGTAGNRDAVGALVTWSAGGVTRQRLKTGGGSYLSSHDPRLVLGLGGATRVDWLEVKWPRPSSRVERFTDLPVDRYVALVEGTGQAARAAGERTIDWDASHAGLPVPRPPRDASRPRPASAQATPRRARPAAGESDAGRAPGPVRARPGGQEAPRRGPVRARAADRRRPLEGVPRSQSSHLLRALALDELGRWDEAQRSYEAALRIAPKDPQIQARFGMHYVRRERWREAIPLLERSLSAGDDALSLFYLSQAYFQTQNKGKALETIERCAKLAPDNPTMLLKLGEYRAQMGKHSPALEALLRVQKLNAAEPGLDLALGNVYLSLLEVENARAALERARQQDPRNPAVISTLANACAKARDHAAARQYYQQVLDLGYDDAEYHLGLGAALLGQGENEAAIVQLNEAIARKPRLEEAHFHLARAYQAAGHAEESKRELGVFRALKANPLDPPEERSELERDLWRQAEALVQAGKEKEALKLLTNTNVKGNTPEYLVGALYYRMGRLSDAERLLTRAVQQSPDVRNVRTYLALAYVEQGLARGGRGDPPR